MIKFAYKKEGESRSVTFSSVSEKKRSIRYDDFSEIDDFFKPKKEKGKFLRSVKKRIDNSKIGGLIYIAIFALVLFVGYATVRLLYYSESVTPEAYEVVELHQKRDRGRIGEIGREYLEIVVEFEAEGKPVAATLYYEGGNRDVIYKDWCAYFAFYDSDKEDTYSYLEQYDNVKEALGTLHYNKKHPEKVVDSILGF